MKENILIKVLIKVLLTSNIRSSCPVHNLCGFHVSEICRFKSLLSAVFV